MTTPHQNPETWVACAVSELRSAGSWTGRIHIHKLLATLELTGIASPPFDFTLHYYGPYSRELDSTIAEMETLGHLDREYEQPGYGPRYQVTPDAPSEIEDSDREAIQKAARKFGKRTSSELELIVTCLWMKKHEGISDKNAAAERVAELKPKYKNDLERIRDSYDEACRLEEALAPT